MTATTVYGIVPTQKEAFLASLLPNGSDRYFGLWETFPTQRDGTGGVEATWSGYARVGHDAWTFSNEDDTVYRVNNGSIVFPTQSEEITMRGWGIWDAATVGNLLYVGHFRTTAGIIIPEITAPSGDFFQWETGRLRIGLR